MTRWAPPTTPNLAEGSDCFLSVPAVAGEALPDVARHLTDIVALLSFAMDTHVNWTESRLLGAAGEILRRDRRTVPVPRAGLPKGDLPAKAEDKK